jgi:hypothetical protein
VKRAVFALLVACSAEPSAGSVVARPVETSSARAPGSSAPASTSASTEALPTTPELRAVAELRRLPPKTGVVASKLSRSELTTLLATIAKEELPEGQLAREGEALAALGLIPASVDYERLLLEELTRLVQGLYIPKRKRLFLLDDLPPDETRAVLDHELLHALQDQHFDLEPLLRFAPGQADRQAARAHLVEGDATVFMALLAQTRPAVEPSPTKTEGGPPALPAFLERVIVSPYVEGSRFVSELLASGGIPALDAAFRDLPASTEQIAHLERYERREAPLVIEVAPAPDAAWRFRDTFGELALRAMLEEWLSPSEAARGAEGWGGDLLVSAPLGEGDIAAGLVVRMDDEAEARELERLSARAFPRGCRAIPSDAGSAPALALVRRGPWIALGSAPADASEKARPCRAAQRLLEAWLERARVVSSAGAPR